VTGVWPINERAGGRPVGWKGWPSGKAFAFVLTHDVEGGRGVQRCLRLAKMEQALNLVSSFNFVPEKYPLSAEVRNELVANGFEVGVHDLRHDGRLFRSEKEFLRQVGRINRYLRSWHAVGFRSGSMYHSLPWMHNMEIEYDSSTFDTDPFEPQPEGMDTVFPLWVPREHGDGGYVELPYTLPQDMTLFVILRHRDSRFWKDKVEWIVERGGMVLLISHPDYMHWSGDRRRIDEYEAGLYEDFLRYIEEKYRDRYWNALPMQVARYWKGCMAGPQAARHDFR